MKGTVTCLLLCVFLNVAYAQKTVGDVKFSACVDRDLAADFYKNKFLVLDFWATWCGPCIGSFPKLDALQKKYSRDSRVVFASISSESKGKIDTFFRQRKDLLPNFLHLVDANGATWRSFDIEAIPAILVFDRSGQLVFNGRIEQLEKSFDRVLAGESFLQGSQKKPWTTNDWETLKKRSVFMAVTGIADPADEYAVATNTNKDNVSFSFKKTAIRTVVESIGQMSAVRVVSNDTAKAKQEINLFFKQQKNNFPERDSGIFKTQYQNHMLYLLEKNYGFHSQWGNERVTAYRIVVTDTQLLRKHLTASTKGAYMSRSDKNTREYIFVNHQLSDIASVAEDELRTPIYTNANSTINYDLTLQFVSISAFKRTLATHGLALEQDNNYELRLLKLIFD